jgi:hypothetical protein
VRNVTETAHFGIWVTIDCLDDVCTVKVSNERKILERFCKSFFFHSFWQSYIPFWNWIHQQNRIFRFHPKYPKIVIYIFLVKPSWNIGLFIIIFFLNTTRNNLGEVLNLWLIHQKFIINTPLMSNFKQNINHISSYLNIGNKWFITYVDILTSTTTSVNKYWRKNFLPVSISGLWCLTTLSTLFQLYRGGSISFFFSYFFFFLYYW